MARALTRRRQPEGARAEARKCLVLDPERPEGHVALGTLHFLADEYGQSISALEQATLLDPTEPEPHVILAQVYADMKRFDEAQAELETARELVGAITDEAQRRKIEASAWHAETYLRMAERKYPQATECAQEIIELADANLHAASLGYSSLGILQARARHYDQASEYLERAYRMNPFLHPAGELLGRVLILQRQHERAAQVLGQVAESMSEGSGGATYYAYALALSKLGSREQALAQYQKALSEGLPRTAERLLARWQVIWLSIAGRYALIAVIVVGLSAWIALTKPSSQVLTVLAVFAVILVLQRTIGRRRS